MGSEKVTLSIRTMGPSSLPRDGNFSLLKPTFPRCLFFKRADCRDSRTKIPWILGQACDGKNAQDKMRNRSEGEKNPPIRNRSDLQHFQQHPQRRGIETRRLSNNIPAPASHALRSCPEPIHADRMGRRTRLPKMGEWCKYHRRVIVQEKRQDPART